LKSESKPRILIVDDEVILRNLLVRYMCKEGFEPIEAADGESAVELYRITRPACVISDVVMPKMDGIDLLSRIRKIDPQAVIILMTGYGNEDVLLKALRGGAANFFKKPFNFQELLDCIRSIVKHKAEIDESNFFSESLVEEAKRFEIAMDKANIFPVINQISIHLRNIFPQSDIINLKIGIEEMLVNAIEHGNLDITYEEKNVAIEQGKFGNLIRDRLASSNNVKKRIVVQSRLTNDLLKVVITDEGKGFDWRALPDPLESNFLTYNGRGIFLTKIFYDEVRFNETGNEVTITKKRK
jgi:DNA-binding response OmpR family regulator/anti-sigma regulatory factor (Ser/Thr protein kinase)